MGNYNSNYELSEGGQISISNSKTTYELKDPVKQTYSMREYFLNGVHFDGLVDGALVEAKYGYEAFLNKAGDGIVDWFGEKIF